MEDLSQGIRIRYINRSVNKDLPQVFVFAENVTPNFKSIEDGVAWMVVKNIGRGSRSTFYYTDKHHIQVAWDDNNNCTALIAAKIGGKYHVVQDKTGIVLKPDGEALNPKSIEIINDIEVVNGVTAQYCKNGNVMLEKSQVGHNQSALFIPSDKLYFGLASEISEGTSLQSAVLNSKNFFELDIAGLSTATVSLNGNAQVGYQFELEQKS